MRIKLLLTISFFIFSIYVPAQPGSLIPSFGESGVVVNTSRSIYSKIGIQPSGKLIVLNSGNGKAYDEVSRYNEDGTLDVSFGNNGRIYFFYEDADGNYLPEHASDMVVQADGKILLVSKNLVLRYTVDGVGDSEFGVNGAVKIELIGVELYFEAMTLGVNGEIVLVGKSNFLGYDHLLMARLNSDGSYDTSFNGGGIRIVNTGEEENYTGVDVATDPENRLLIGVSKGIQTASVHEGFLTRYTNTGSLDLTFSGQGKMITNYPPRDVCVNQNGAILFSGINVYLLNSELTNIKTIFQGSSSGSDLPFIATTDLNFQPDGKIIIVGIIEYSINDYSKIFVRRLMPDGNYDRSFGDNGVTVTDLNFKTIPYAVIYKNRRLFLSGDLIINDNGLITQYGLINAYDASDARMTCPNVQSSYPADAGSCYATVNGINPVMSTSTLYANVKYKLEYNGTVIDEGEGGVSGKQFQKGITKVTYSYTDITTQTCSFNIVVDDKEPPKIFCPVAVQINNTHGKCYGELTVQQLGTPIATDNCSSKINITISGNPLNDQYPIGVTTITWEATDEAGNTATCSQTVTVIDNENPTISIQSKSVNTDPGKCYATLTLDDLGVPVIADNCMDGIVVTPPELPANNIFPKGITQLTWMVTDASGNKGATVQMVTVTDNELPVIENISATPDVLTPPDRKLKDVTINYTTSDNCGVQSAVISNITSNELVDGPGAGNTSPDWEYVDAHHVRLRAERIATGDGRTYTITILCTDVSGNISTNTVNVYVRNSIISPKSGQPFIVNSTVNMKGEFWDKSGSTHKAKWLIDDVTTTKATITEPSGNKNGTVIGSYKFTSPGVYKLQIDVTDPSGDIQHISNNGLRDALVVIYDPNGGYTYGGGWYTSPAGTLINGESSNANGDVSFGYTVNYYKGATKPKGEAEIKFGDFEFNAVNFDYLVVSGARASFAGIGKITGVQSGINFIMTVIDGQVDGTGIDKIRIKIYNKNTGQIYYDSQPGAGDYDSPITQVGEGSTIVISSVMPNATQARTIAPVQTEMSTPFSVNVYPNPAASDFVININSNDSQPSLIRITNSIGQVVKYLSTNSRNITIGKDLKQGIYMIEVRQGVNNQTVKLIKH